MIGAFSKNIYFFLLQKGIYDIFDSWRFYKTLQDKKKLTWRFPERENKCTAEVYSFVYSKLAIYIINSVNKTK